VVSGSERWFRVIQLLHNLYNLQCPGRFFGVDGWVFVGMNDSGVGDNPVAGVGEFEVFQKNIYMPDKQKPK